MCYIYGPFQIRGYEDITKGRVWGDSTHTHKPSSRNPFGLIAPLGSVTIHVSHLGLGKPQLGSSPSHLIHRHGRGEDIILYSLTWAEDCSEGEEASFQKSRQGIRHVSGPGQSVLPCHPSPDQGGLESSFQVNSAPGVGAQACSSTARH